MLRARCVRRVMVAAATLAAIAGSGAAIAQNAPALLDGDLRVRRAAANLTTPVSVALLGPGEMLVNEKNTGRVRHVVGGEIAGTVLDLAVNSASERGLLGIAVHPDFDANGYVYLYWTCAVPPPPASDRSRPTRRNCPTPAAGASDSSNVLAVPLLGNRVDRFVWTGSRLTFDRNIIALRAFQNDETNGGPAGNHDGGVIRFGPDGHLYIAVGDVGRRGQFQNVRNGPFPGGRPDDQFGGPAPDDAHLTGAILRLRDDGGTPADNPFYEAGARTGGEAGANIQRTFAYGLRNSFGMAFDPLSGHLWMQDNGDDTFDELNLVEPGANLGWVQIMGPLERLSQFRSSESNGLQQRRWPGSRIAASPAEALSRLFMLPGAQYSDPEFSWRFVVPPAGIGFTSSTAFGPGYAADLIVGHAGGGVEGGSLFRFRLRADRLGFVFSDRQLDDLVADNARRGDIAESESLRWGTGFGAVTDIQRAADGRLYVVSISHGAVYEILRRTPLPPEPPPPPPPPEPRPRISPPPIDRPWLQPPLEADR